MPSLRAVQTLVSEKAEKNPPSAVADRTGDKEKERDPGEDCESAADVNGEVAENNGVGGGDGEASLGDCLNSQEENELDENGDSSAGAGSDNDSTNSAGDHDAATKSGGIGEETDAAGSNGEDDSEEDDNADSWRATPSEALAIALSPGAGGCRFRRRLNPKKATLAASPVSGASPTRLFSAEQILNPSNQGKWQKNMAALRAFKQRYGDTAVPKLYGALGSFVKNLKFLHKSSISSQPSPKCHNLTEEQRRELDELGFQWELPNCNSHALRQRMRNITRAASALREMYQTCPASGGGWTTHVVSRGDGAKKVGDRYYFSPEGKRFRSMAEVRRHLDEEVDEEDSLCPQKHALAKIIATETIELEENKLDADKDDLLRATFRVALSVGVSELDLFRAFEDIGGLWNQDTYNRTKEEVMWDELIQLQELSLTEIDKDRPMLQYCQQPRKGFETWLSVRKDEWKQQQHRTRAKKRSEMGGSSLSVQSVEQFQNWLSERKDAWREQPKRKRNRNQPASTETNDTQVINYRTAGVRQTDVGNWEVGVTHKGLRLNLGVFDTQDKAAIANEAAREMLKSECAKEKTTEEIEESIKQARVVALNALQKRMEQKQKENSSNSNVNSEECPTTASIGATEGSRYGPETCIFHPDQNLSNSKVKSEECPTTASIGAIEESRYVPEPCISHPDQNTDEKGLAQKATATIQVPAAGDVDAMQIYEDVKGKLSSAKSLLKSHKESVTHTSYEMNTAQFKIEFYYHIKCVLADTVISKDVIDRIQTLLDQFESAIANLQQPKNDEVDVRFYGKCCTNIIAAVKQLR